MFGLIHARTQITINLQPSPPPTLTSGRLFGSWCAIQLLLAVETAVERDHVGFVPSDRGRSDGLVACANTQPPSLRRHCGFNPIFSQVHPPVCELSHTLRAMRCRSSPARPAFVSE